MFLIMINIDSEKKCSYYNDIFDEDLPAVTEPYLPLISLLILNQ